MNEEIDVQTQATGATGTKSLHLVVRKMPEKRSD